MTKRFTTPLLAAATLAAAVSAHAGEDTTSVSIGGSIGASCTASAQQVELGSVQSAELFTPSGVPADITLTVNCSMDAPYAIALGNAWAYQSQVTPESTLELEMVDATLGGIPLGPTGSGMQYTSAGMGGDETLTVTGGIVRGSGRRAALGPVTTTLSNVFTISY